MREQLAKRLQDLKVEYEMGEQMLTDLEAKKTNLRETLLRISGAMQVLEELLKEVPPVPEANGQVADDPIPEAAARE